MATVLVTGAQGMLGCHLVPHLCDCGHQVVRHSRSGCAEVQIELTDIDQVHSALEQVAPDVIVNLAALANVDECERSPQLAYLANVRTVENLADWIGKSGRNCHLVHISTDQIYDGDGLHDEHDITLTNYYGFSKYAGELAANTVPRTVLRTNFFGPSRCQGRVGLSDWLVQSLSAGKKITVFDDLLFSPLSLQRLVELIALVVARREPGVFNIGSNGGMSKADFAFALAEALDLPVDTMSRGVSGQSGLVAYRPKNMRMDVSRFESIFGVVLPSLQEEIYSMRAAYAQETR